MTRPVSYLPIPLAQGVPVSVKAFVHHRVEPILRDVRLMLTYPRQANEPGFNLTAAAALFSVIHGIARVFHSTERLDGQSFRLIAGHYPLSEEPVDAIRDPDDFGVSLYDVYRCNLAHCVGLATDWSPSKKRWEIINLGAVTKVVRQPPVPLPSVLLDELDGVSNRPTWLDGTITNFDGVTRLNVEALYHGIRKLTKQFAEDRSLQADAIQFLKPWSQSNPLLELDVAVQSTTNTVHSFTAPSINATLGPLTATVVTLGSPIEGNPEHAPGK